MTTIPEPDRQARDARDPTPMGRTNALMQKWCDEGENCIYPASSFRPLHEAIQAAITEAVLAERRRCAAIARAEAEPYRQANLSDPERDYDHGYFTAGALIGTRIAEKIEQPEPDRGSPIFFGAEDQWTCPSCGLANHELRKHCRNCGRDKAIEYPEVGQ